MSDDAKVSVRAKVRKIFQGGFGDCSAVLQFGHGNQSRVLSPIAEAFGGDFDTTTAEEIAFHATDWPEDAALIVALHLFPEQFTPAEIRAGIDAFAVHVPYHAMGLAHALGYEPVMPWETDCDPTDENT